MPSSTEATREDGIKVSNDLSIFINRVNLLEQVKHHDLADLNVVLNHGDNVQKEEKRDPFANVIAHFFLAKARMVATNNVVILQLVPVIIEVIVKGITNIIKVIDSINHIGTVRLVPNEVIPVLVKVRTPLPTTSGKKRVKLDHKKSTTKRLVI